MTGHFFISYSHEDRAYVSQLAKEMEERGFSAWTDGQIKFGEKWPTVLKERIDNCLGFVIVMSPDAEKSDVVQEELLHARNLGKPIIPLLLAGKGAMFLLNAPHFSDVRNGELPTEGFYEALRACGSDPLNGECKDEIVKRDAALAELKEANRTTYFCKYCNFPVPYDSLTGTAMALLLGLPFFGSVVTYYLSSWLGSAIFFAVSSAVMLILITTNEAVFKEPSICPECHRRLKRPLRRHESGGGA